ncbi:lmo0937 family membrane protein [Phenylobacterium sp.]
MLATIAIVLLVLWLLGFFAFHVTSAAIHVLLLIALVMVVLHFFRGRRSL